MGFLQAVANAFGIPPEHVFRRAGLLSPRLEVDENVEELLHYYEQLSPEERRHIRVTARALAEARAAYQAQEDEASGKAGGES